MDQIGTPEAETEIVDRPILFAALLAIFALTALAVLASSLAEGRGLAVVASAIFLAGCLFAAPRAIRVSRLTLRPDGSARFEVRDLRGLSRHEIPAGGLRAGVQHHRDGDGVSGRVMLLIDGPDGTVTRLPFTGYLASPERAAQTVATVEKWRMTTGTA
jgi:hypothetical protein